MQPEKKIIMDLKKYISGFIHQIKPDRAVNTLNVINKYEQSLQDMGNLTIESALEKDLQVLRVVLDNIGDVVKKAQKLAIPDKLKARVLEQIQGINQQLLTFDAAYRLDERGDDLLQVFLKDISELPSSRKELVNLRDRFVSALDLNAPQTRVLVARLFSDIKQLIGSIETNEDFSRLIYMALLFEALIVIDDLKSRESLALMEKYLARIVVLSLKAMSETFDFNVVIKNMNFILKQLPSRVKQIVEAAVPPKWKYNLGFEEVVVYTSLMNDKLFGSNMPGLVVKKLALGEGVQDEVIRFLDTIRQNKKTRREFALELATKSRPVVDEVLKLLSDDDHRMVKELLLPDQQGVQIIRKKM